MRIDPLEFKWSADIERSYKDHKDSVVIMSKQLGTPLYLISLFMIHWIDKAKLFTYNPDVSHGSVKIPQGSYVRHQDPELLHDQGRLITSSYTPKYYFQSLPNPKPIDKHFLEITESMPSVVGAGDVILLFSHE